MLLRMVPLAFMLFICGAQALDSAQVMDAMSWEKRVLVIFAPDVDNRELRLQNAVLAAEQDGLAERHMAVIRVLANKRVSIDGKSEADNFSNFHEYFNARPDRFRVLLVGKDGGVKLDREVPVSTGELFSLIDSMPMRRQEMLQDG